MDNFNFELAIKFCERALDMEPENVEVLEMAGAVFLETGDVDKAKSVSFKFDVSFIMTQILFVVTSLLFLSSTNYLQVKFFISVFQCRPNFCAHHKHKCDNSFYFILKSVVSENILCLSQGGLFEIVLFQKISIPLP